MRNEQVIKDWPSHLATEFDGLSVLRWIGERSFTVEFLAREIKPERLVALTVLKADVAADAEVHARFESEALAAAQVVHPNVAAIYRVGKRKDGLPYIVRDYIGAHSLAESLRSFEVRTVDESIRTIVSLAKALAAAASKGIAHGNVNPENILIERDSGRVVLTNFGIAGQWEAGEGLSDARYASPEQLRGEVAAAGSDIFSLGVIAYELFKDRVPEELDRLLLRCVDSNAAARPTAAELVQLLPSDERTEAPLNPMQPTQRAAESFLMRVAVIAGLVIMAIGAVVTYSLYVHYSPEQTQQVESEGRSSDD